MARKQKLFKLMTIAEFQKGDSGIAIAVTYAKDCRGAKITFEHGTHCGKFMLVWDCGNKEITL